MSAGPGAPGRASWRERGHFLFRNDSGTVDAATWRLHAAWLFALFLALTGVWIVLRPYTHHDLATSAFLAPLTILAFTYLIVYAFVVLLIVSSYVMLSIKRLRDRGAPPGLAGLVPLLALFAASLDFLWAKTPDVIVLPYVIAMDVALLAAIAWTIVDLGFRPGRNGSAGRG